MQTFCATIVHGDQKLADQLHQRIVTTTYEQARNGAKEIEGFPIFGPVVSELKQCQNQNGCGAAVPAKDFQVCTPQVDGCLIVKEQFFKQFEESMPEFADVLAAHNEKYNPDGHRIREVQESPKKDDTLQLTELVDKDDPMTPEKLTALPAAFLDFSLSSYIVSSSSNPLE